MNRVEIVEIPLPPSLLDEVMAFWEEMFGSRDRTFVQAMRGREQECHRDTLYLLRHGGALAGTAHLTVAREAPALGGLGEVATDAPFRGRGVATRF